ncbi:inactive transglutaminase family protein [Marinobacter koreensis]|uniref:Inactive transglutaminase family protein n=2 Tax=Marinobacter koreensis TaxID=335974 RepID=A0ABW0RPQ8_9GAMM|nr:inactive transglutaminase family protein [Marinobacter koreensis]MCK7549566.1 inactive transglutaminase family protein [Marinobacter koreensis]
MTNPSRIPFYVAVLLLIGAGISLAIWRHMELGIPWLAGEQRPVWMVEARIDFDSNNGPVLASLNVPEQPPGFSIISEQAASPGYGFSIVGKNGNRRAEWTKRDVVGPQTLYFKAQFVPSDRDRPDLSARKPRAHDVFWEEPQATAVREILDQARERSSTPESMTREVIRLMRPDGANQNTALLASDGDNISLLVKMLNHAGIPARTADGLRLEDARRRQQLMPFLQIYNGSRWLTFDPKTGEQGLPDNLLLWREGSASLLDVVGGDNSRVSFSMLRQTVPALQLATMQSKSNSLGYLGFYELPIEEQSMFRLLLLLPLGAFVVAFMRMLIGIRTSGTFMPVLIAVAFVQTALIPGLVAFVAIVAIGLLMRGYLSSLNLLLVSRISALIILVIFITAGLSVFGYQMGFNTGMTVTFFPMVIIAWTIERMSILWEEEGVREVLIQGTGSLFVAVCAYLLMSIPLSGHLTFNFPELHLVILGLILLMGQYTGYKLTELRRFSPMKVYD